VGKWGNKGIKRKEGIALGPQGQQTERYTDYAVCDNCSIYAKRP